MKASGFGAQIGLKPTTTSDGFPKDLQPQRRPQRNYLKLRPKQEKLLLILVLKKNFWNLISNEDREVMSSEHLGLHKTSKKSFVFINAKLCSIPIGILEELYFQLKF